MLNFKIKINDCYFKIEELDTQYELTCNGCYIHYLEAIQKDLDTREF